MAFRAGIGVVVCLSFRFVAQHADAHIDRRPDTDCSAGSTWDGMGIGDLRNGSPGASVASDGA